MRTSLGRLVFDDLVANASKCSGSRPVNNGVDSLAPWEHVLGQVFLEGPALLNRIEWSVRVDPLANAMVVQTRAGQPLWRRYQSGGCHAGTQCEATLKCLHCVPCQAAMPKHVIASARIRQREECSFSLTNDFRPIACSLLC